MPKLVLIRRWRDGHTFTTLIRETRRTKRRVYGEWVAGEGAALMACGYAPLSTVLCENATQAQFDAIRKAEADYSRVSPSATALILPRLNRSLRQCTREDIFARNGVAKMSTRACLKKRLFGFDG